MSSSAIRMQTAAAAPEARGCALALAGIGHSFGGTIALDAIDLTVAPGELIALLGPSGCGKTTLLQIIAGFLQPSRGSVAFDGLRVDHTPANRRRIGMVFQNYALFPHLTVAENVAYGLRARQAPRAMIQSRVAEMLARVQMTAFGARFPRQLSGGQQQRVALARALAIDPVLVLLDEPFSALDKNLRLDMQIEIKSLLKSCGVTSIIVTHDQEEALSMADRIVVLNKGRIEQIDTPDALYDAPASLFVNGFIGHANFLEGRTTDPRGHVALAAGGTLALPQAGQRPAGTEITVSIRPENLTLSAGDAPGAIPTTIRVVMPLGAVSVIECVMASGESVKVSQSRAAWSGQPGVPAWLGITDITKVHVFDAPAGSPSITRP
ncbi:ABC transporter ATP-binding protein [Bradyrhizobium sp. STM 3809]|uniref:ABC transporter ATP-binding protein n=1 Tax=Bradyrhizobium sp. STM 3809 TaxID=551936 RepID=UPI000240981E|nr:ABC transporter ATP-binding protein [Bradyrhizobium sp. STM 3809]CCE01517.1 putative ABC transporter (ATP-binding protein) [Bradyrhizobium sp. STM 3809]